MALKLVIGDKNYSSWSLRAALAVELAGVECEEVLVRLYQDVLLKRVTMADAASHLKDLGQRQLAYEMAVCVCEADGRHSAEETAFLARLSALLGLEAGAAEAFIHEAEAVAEAPAAGALTALPGFDASASPSATASATPSNARP